MTTKYTSSAAAAFIEFRGFLALALFLAVALLFALRVPLAPSTFYADALGEQKIVETVVSEGRHYTVADGVIENGADLSSVERSRVLRLAWAKALAERSPYMALAGTDPEQFTAAVNALAQTQDRLARTQPNVRDSALVRSSLYPISFLRALAQTERARVRFLSSGSDTDERSYYLAVKEAFSAYAQDLSQFKRAFTQAVPDTAPPYETAGRKVDKQNIEQALETLAQGAATMERSFNDRERCLLGDAGRCASGDLAFPTPDAPEMPATSPAAIAQALDVRSFFSAGDIHTGFTGPLIELPASMCASGLSAPPLFSVQDSGKPRLALWYVGDLLLIDSHAQTQLPFFNYFANHGVDYIISSPLLYYKCLLSTYDTGTVLGVNAVIQFARSSPVSALMHGPEKPKLHTMERTLVTTQTVTQAAAARYVRAASAALRDSRDEPARTALATLALELNNKSARFDSTLQEIVSIENTNSNLNESADAVSGVSVPLDAAYLFYVRNGFVSLFLSWNPSATGIHQPLFPVSANTAKDPFILYSSLPHTPSMREKIMHDVEFYFSVHLDAKEPYL